MRRVEKVRKAHCELEGLQVRERMIKREKEKGQHIRREKKRVSVSER